MGKTTLAKSIVKDKRAYVNWDISIDKERILTGQLPDFPILVLDEIHKYRRWRNFMKGLYDGREPGQSFLLTGSAKLDYYRFSGDSLQGRYHYFRLHPLSVVELGIRTNQDLRGLMNLGGFPEPFFSGSAAEAKRWSREYKNRLIREEITALEQVKDLDLLTLLMLSLPKRVGSPLSLNSLSEDLQVSHKTLSRWISILERMYAIFRLAPFGYPKLRAVKKEQKHYHFDWTVVTEESYRFENLVANHLLKWVDFEIDTKGRELELRYFRDDAGREVDFVITEDENPILFVEAKLSDDHVTRGLNYLKAKFPSCEAFQISLKGTKRHRTSSGIHVCPAVDYLAMLV